MTRKLLAAAVAVLTVTGLLALAPSGASADDYTVPAEGRTSVGHENQQADDRSVIPSASGNGRLIAFESNATNLVPGDTNNVSDIFVRDTVTGQTFRASVATDGTEADGPSRGPVISTDGTTIAFVSTATNLVEGDTNGVQDVFVHDLETGVTTRASVGADGAESPAPSRNPSVSASGDRVAFDTTAGTLVDGDLNGVTDVFVRDLTAATTVRASLAEDGTEGDSFSFAPSLSGSGLVVAFASRASNLVAGDDNDTNDVFVADLDTGAMELISRGLDGGVAAFGGGNGSVQPKISDDGAVVAFLSEAPDLVVDDTNETTDVFVHDRTTGTTERVSVADDGTEGNSFSFSPSITGDGSSIAFASGATNLVPGDTNSLFDIFVHNRRSASTSRVNLNSNGEQANSFSFAPSISADGSLVAFYSSASNLVPGDTNFLADVFVSRLLLCGGVEVDVDLNSGETPTDGDDVILGTPGPDVIDAGDGDDIVCGGGGDDVIAGGEGDDEIDGGGGDDVIAGGAGDDLLVGGAGDDAISGHAGDDLIDGGDGDDAMVGGAGIDVLDGGDGLDAVNADAEDIIVDPDPEPPITAEGGDDSAEGGDDAGEDAPAPGDGPADEPPAELPQPAPETEEPSDVAPEQDTPDDGAEPAEETPNPVASSGGTDSEPTD